MVFEFFSLSFFSCPFAIFRPQIPASPIPNLIPTTHQPNRRILGKDSPAAAAAAGGVLTQLRASRYGNERLCDGIAQVSREKARDSVSRRPSA